MPMSSRIILVISTLLAAYLSLSKLGGLLVFGFNDLVTFALFGLPVLAFPVQLVALWRLRLGIGLFCLLTLIYGLTVAGMVGFSPADVAKKNSYISLYLLNVLLLIVVDVIRRRAQGSVRQLPTR
jgi:hypothetical protein